MGGKEDGEVRVLHGAQRGDDGEGGGGRGEEQAEQSDEGLAHLGVTWTEGGRVMEGNDRQLGEAYRGK